MNTSDMDTLRDRAAKIRMLAVDVDGVLTDGRLYFDQHGNELKAFYTRDGLGMKALQRFDIRLAIITGRKSRIVQDRADHLGIEHIYQGRDDKLNALDELVSLIKSTGPAAAAPARSPRCAAPAGPQRWAPRASRPGWWRRA